MNIKTALLASAAGPRYPVQRFGAPGLLRGPSIALRPEDDQGGGGGSGDDDDGDTPPPGGQSPDPAAYQALVANHERLKRDAKKDRDALKAIREELDAQKREREAAEQDAAHKSGDVEKVKSQLEAKHAVEVKSLTARAEKAEAQVRKLVVEGNLSASLDEVRVKPELKRAVTAMLLREGIELEEDEENNPVPMKGGLPLAQAIKLWAESEEGKAFVLDGNSGGGAQGGGKPTGRNPWKRETWSLTEQDTVTAKNPALAGRLKAEAGVA